MALAHRDDSAGSTSFSTRTRIIEAALALFAERGYHGTTIPAVMAQAGVGGGSLYRLFASKELLVNVVFREAKGRLQRALAEGLPTSAAPRALFDELWARLAGFARAEPTALRFLELQDHTPYLDGESRQLELAVLAPIVVGCMDFQRRGVFLPDVTPDVVIASIWGAFVGLVKAARLGYLSLTPSAVAAARDACWRAFAAATPKKAQAAKGSHHGNHARSQRAPRPPVRRGRRRR
jgi:AcrR family transcriptional regulator